jgi:hypothetical protein
MTGPTHTQYWVGPAPPGPPRIDATGIQRISIIRKFR